MNEKGYFIKDLQILGNRDLSRVVLVDNHSTCFGQQMNNGVPILPFYFKEDDIELIKLKNFLLSLYHECLREDCSVQSILKDYFMLEEYVGAKSLELLYNKLFMKI